MNQEEKMIESLKLEFEWHKHLTTLISGLVLVIATLLKAFFFKSGSPPLEDGQRIALFFSFGGLGIALLSSIFSMYFVSRSIRQEEPRPFPPVLTLGYSLVGFVGGLYAFVIFAWLRV